MTELSDPRTDHACPSCSDQPDDLSGDAAARRKLLPMAGHTRGKRSAVTCALKCDSACAKPVPNTSENGYFRDIASSALSRRRALGLAGAGAFALAVGGSGLAAATPGHGPGHGSGHGHGPGGRTNLPFRPISPVAATEDTFVVPQGYTWEPIIRWGDPILPGGVPFDASDQSAEKQALAFGYNNDYTDVIVTNRAGTKALLCCNHEYVNPAIMFPPDLDAAEQLRIAMAAHGFAIVELERSRPGERWRYVPSAPKNRRITASTPFRLTGPAAGSDLLRTAADPTGTVVLGTIGNCSGGTTPWGTILSGEENFNGYFRADGSTPENKRYGLSEGESTYGWEAIEPRFDARTADYANEPNRFGYIVEIDPTDPTSTPRKHTSLGRLKHEGANVVVAKNGHVVAYTGDDERFDYLYKFVSKGRYDKRDRRRNLDLLTEGDLYVARFHGDSPASQIDGTGTLPRDGRFDGYGQWIPLVRNGRSKVAGMSVEEVLVFTRLAADRAGATKMDRCEDVQPSPTTGKVYVACTNNSQRGTSGRAGVDEANPRTENKDGHIVEIVEDDGDHTSRVFRWNLVIVAGDPAAEGTYFAGYPKEKVSPISCPDNLAFDSEGNLWISTDGQPSSIQKCDGLFKVPLEGRERGHVQQFLSVPRDAETCGPVVHDRDGSIFVAVQHPGEDGTWDAQRSRFPDYVEGRARVGEFAGPRPAVVQVLRG
ncbi:secreted PhoX family phosphatase [Nocardioides luteus]|uniref:Phosphatase n=1 Tax=Nocardioides luteus TaxID=1844 RepID=A0ABQ5SYV0_9ACTN|nr:PhoX family phosphatase [Nocardioides luteus]MDR7312377.1 secreted PhoX family phosphatase [Nocardioides luteus]GGR58078.1 phosphatase [Nocardioides luteus]GLJ68624.1 phosphatase [Nocardioides luteus]